MPTLFDVTIAWGSFVAFALFILLNATLFVRPAEIVPALLGLPIYNVLISTCLVVSLPAILAQLTGRSLAERPITACVVGLLAAVVLSHLSHFSLGEARTAGEQFVKVVLYYLLLVSTVDSPAKLRTFQHWLVGLIIVVAGLALLQYYNLVNIPALEVLQVLQEGGEVDEDTGERFVYARLRSTGIFNDPNDLCLILSLAIITCLYFAGDRRSGPLRFLWLAPVGLCGHALTLTQSRGGLLGLLAGLLGLFCARFGWRKTIPLAILMVPAVLLLVGGRQANITTGSGTGQERIQLWNEGLILFRRAPLFGIGYNMYADEVGLVAHNSYIHCYTELGFFGGTLFLGAFCLALTGLRQLGSGRISIPDPELRRLRPYLIAIISAYCIGMYSLSRAYVQPTYLVLGLVAVYLRLASDKPPLRLDAWLLQRVTLVSVAVLAFLHVYVRLFVRYG